MGNFILILLIFINIHWIKDNNLNYWLVSSFSLIEILKLLEKIIKFRYAQKGYDDNGSGWIKSALGAIRMYGSFKSSKKEQPIKSENR
jgi:hypothetical protein